MGPTARAMCHRTDRPLNFFLALTAGVYGSEIESVVHAELLIAIALEMPDFGPVQRSANPMGFFVVLVPSLTP